jgi:hypothetical protein
MAWSPDLFGGIKFDTSAEAHGANRSLDGLHPMAKDYRQPGKAGGMASRR